MRTHAVGIRIFTLNLYEVGGFFLFIDRIIYRE